MLQIVWDKPTSPLSTNASGCIARAGAVQIKNNSDGRKEADAKNRHPEIILSFREEVAGYEHKNRQRCLF